LAKDVAIGRFVTQLSGKFQLAEGAATLQAVVIDVDPQTGRATSIERLSVGEGDL
jgi:hypothetical protein